MNKQSSPGDYDVFLSYSHSAATIEDLLRRLESAGHSDLANDLRRQFAAKQPRPRKPWWKFGR